MCICNSFSHRSFRFVLLKLAGLAVCRVLSQEGVGTGECGCRVWSEGRGEEGERGHRMRKRLDCARGSSVDAY